MFKRILSMLLCLLTLCSIIPMTAMTASAAAEAVSSDIKISNFNLTTKSMTEPKIDTGAGGMFYDYTYITINNVKYYPGDQFPAGALNVGDYRTVTIQFTPISGCYFVTESDGTSYAGKVTIGNQELTAYVNSSGILKVMFRMYVNSPDITTAITVDGVDFPVHGAEARSSVLKSKTTMSHSGLKVTSAYFAFQKSGNTTWYLYPNNTLDSSFSYEKFALCVMYEVDPAYNITGFVNKITWNGKGVDAYAPLTNGKGYAIYFYCDIADELTQVTITDIEPPVHGATPDRTGTAPKGIEITKIQYIKASDRSGEYEGTFDAIKHVGKDYIELGVEIRATDGYTFNPKFLKVYCNGMTSTLYVNRGDGKYVFVFPLTVAQKHVDMVHVADIDPAVDGATPDREGTVKESDMVELTGVQYVMKSDRSGEYMGKFDAKKHVGKDAIELGIELKAKPGYVIDNTTVVTVNGDFSHALVKRDEGRIVYIMPDLAITQGFDNPFVDVKDTDYFYSAVSWAVMSGVTAGVDATHFGPNKTCTRAQAVSFIYRAAGSPAINKATGNPFKDVKESDYFYNAVLWAVDQGITAGVSADKFAPNSNCTRAQIVSFIHRWAGSPKARGSANPFKDVKESDYFYNAVLWAVENNITAGMSADKFAPNNKCTRGQIVCFLERWMHQGDLEIVTNPEDYRMYCSDEDATFTVTIKGDHSPYTYEWTVWIGGNKTYTETHKTYATADTFKYRVTDYDFDNGEVVVGCIIRDSYGGACQTYSAQAIPKEGKSLTIVHQPLHYQMKSSSEDATFKVKVRGGDGNYTYRWIINFDGDGQSETVLTTSTTSTFSFPITDYDFDEYREIVVWCEITDGQGNKVTTNEAEIRQKK
ncbi:MAG: S-layer homology domain-containing protein [Clostridia bacterium]|nr:S-layer homology domain-containing protein [Clostridia bacterium]